MPYLAQLYRSHWPLLAATAAAAVTVATGYLLAYLVFTICHALGLYAGAPA